MEEITNDVLLGLGFKKVNNSTWRNGNFTLQNCWTSKGAKTFIEKTLMLNKGYKLCLNGKFNGIFTKKNELVKRLNAHK